MLMPYLFKHKKRVRDYCNLYESPKLDIAWDSDSLII